MGAVPLEDLDGPRLVPIPRFADLRGHFQVSWNAQILAKCGIDTEFVQDNFAQSRRGVLRGMHYQSPGAQGKLVSVLVGEIFDVVIDVRVGSRTEGNWTAVTLNAERAESLWVPKGFAHGYQSLTDGSLVMYKVDAPYRPEQEISITPVDPVLGIDWPISDMILNDKDRAGLPLADAPRWTQETAP